MRVEPALTAGLLDSDPARRWQVERDLQEAYGTRPDPRLAEAIAVIDGRSPEVGASAWPQLAPR